MSPDEQLKAELNRAAQVDDSKLNRRLFSQALKALTDAETQRADTLQNIAEHRRQVVAYAHEVDGLKAELVEAKHSVRVAQESEDAVALNCKNWIEDYGDLELQLAEANRRLEAIRKWAGQSAMSHEREMAFFRLLNGPVPVVLDTKEPFKKKKKKNR